MRLKTIDSPKIEPWEGEVRITTEHSVSPLGRPVILFHDDEPLSVSTFQTEFEIVEATPEEMTALKQGGYILLKDD